MSFLSKKNIPLIFVIIAGETIFMLPFLIPRLFRPLMLETWNISNTDVGLAFSAYGFSSMASYIIGGPLADKYPPRNLIAISLILTALGGGILLFKPSSITLIIAYFYFGISTILLMWGALIKITHEIGGEKNRAGAMGFLESGRGLIAAMMSSVLLYIISTQSNKDGELTNKLLSINSIYISVIVFTLLVSIIVWFTLKDVETKEAKKHDWTLEKAIIILKDSNVWLLGFVVLTAYCGYKNVDNYSVYLVDVHKASLLKSSSFTTIISWARPISALLSGLIADRVTRKITGGRFLTLAILFSLGGLSQLLLAFEMVGSFSLIFNVILFSAVFTYAIRSIYFAVFGDFNIPDNIVGTTVGIVSLIGFLPDFFFGTFTGYLIDTNPGQQGFTYVFSFTGGVLLLGAIACIFIFKRIQFKT